MISENINNEDTNEEVLNSIEGSKPKGYLNWNQTVVGIINMNNEVNFVHPKFNEVVLLYTKGKSKWSSEEFKEFLKDRIVSKNRRDIEKILKRCNLVEYNVFDIAFVTRAFNVKDLFWISESHFEKMKDVIGDSFSNIFSKPLDELGDSTYSPDGVNIKSYGINENDYGLYKLRLNPYSSDVESEVAVYKLSRLIGVKCCKAELVRKRVRHIGNNRIDNVAFSKFEYDFTNESIIHARQFIKDSYRLLFDKNEYKMLKHIFPNFKEDIARMILIDFITRQTDRHASNFAIKINADETREFYPLYDNGRSLFYEDKVDFINEALNDIPLYSSEFGEAGTYYDYAIEVSEDFKISDLINLNVTREQIYNAYLESNIGEGRLEGAVEWTFRSLQILKKLDSKEVI